VDVIADLTADNGEVAQRRGDDSGLQTRIVVQDEAQDREREEQQREERQEAVVGDERL
jgi:hypothetical protein